MEPVRGDAGARRPFRRPYGETPGTKEAGRVKVLARPSRAARLQGLGLRPAAFGQKPRAALGSATTLPPAEGRHGSQSQRECHLIAAPGYGSLGSKANQGSNQGRKPWWTQVIGLAAPSRSREDL